VVGKPGGKMPLKKPGRKKVDYIEMHFIAKEWGNKDWVTMARVR
jgi:hypothetical protein